jgi:hypothetical protein
LTAIACTRASIAARRRLLTRTGLDWTHKYPAIAAAVASIGASQAYLDGELSGVGPDGITSFSMIQLASGSGNAAALIFFLFDLLHLDSEDLCFRPLIERKERLAELLANGAHRCTTAITKSDAAESFTTKPAPWASRASSPNAPLRLTRLATSACGSRSNACIARNLSSSAGPTPKARGHGSARCCSPTTIRMESCLCRPRRYGHQAGEAGAAVAKAATARRLRDAARGAAAAATVASDRRSCSAVSTGRGPSSAPRFKYLTCTDDNLLRQVVYDGLREDKPAVEVCRQRRI